MPLLASRAVPDLKSLDNVYLVLAFVVPGLVALFCRAQFLTGRMPSQAEAILPSFALSLVYYAIVFPIIEYLPEPRGHSFAIVLAWVAFIFVGLAILGAALGIGTQKGWGRNIIRRLLGRLDVTSVHQVPTAWDWKFSS